MKIKQQEHGTSSGGQSLTPLMTTRDVAEYLKVPVGTIRKWRIEGVGPPSFRMGRGLRFRREDVEAWLEERRDVDPRFEEQGG